MNRTPPALLGLMLSYLLWISPAAAQDAAGLEAAKAADNQQTHLAQIDQFVKEQVQRLLGEDPAARSSARDALIAQTMQNPSTPATAAFLDAYAQKLNEALREIGKNPDLRARLNAAIVVAEVAEKSRNKRMEDVVVELINDPSDAVALWGMKASRSMLPIIVRNKLFLRDSKLIPALVPAVVKQKDRIAPIVQEAYEALRIGWFPRISPDARRKITPEMINGVVPLMLDILDFRLGQYMTGIPDEPATENTATFFLTDSQIWKALSPADKTRTIQTLLNLLSLAAQQTAKAGPQEKAQLVAMIRGTAQAIQVVNPALKDPMKKAVEISPGMTSIVIQEIIKGIYPALIQIEPFKDLQPPPSIQSGS